MNEIQIIVKKQKEFFNTGQTKEIEFRIHMLKKLRDGIRVNQDQIFKSLNLDLNKSSFEAYETEIGIVLEEIRYTLKNISVWTKTKRVKTPIVHFPSSSYLHKEPYGVVLNIVPWNYPFQLAITPLIGAIASGNCCIIKPSEYAPHTAQVIEKIITQVFSQSYVAVIQGEQRYTQLLLQEKFDYIFFTGSITGGKIIMEAAAKNLTPVTLELGGKSPCIIDETANISLAAKRIIWGKFLNAGQTCVAPDYLLVHHSVKEQLILEMEKVITTFYGTNPISNKDYPKIINKYHFDRLLNLMEDEKIVIGGQYNEQTEKISPTILAGVSWESLIMEDEIFGPLLPILTFKNIEEVFAKISERPKPLALYLFTKSKKNELKTIQTLSFGGGCINDTVIHLSNPNLPFGGLGESGMGRYHGKDSFNTFSHTKSIIKKSNILDISFRYPPFGKRLKLLKILMR